MLDYAKEGFKLASNLSRSDLDSNRVLNLALVRIMEVIGEAASRVPYEFRTMYPNVPWRQIIGFRNKLIHGYDAIDLDILWKIINSDLPKLIEQLKVIIKEHR